MVRENGLSENKFGFRKSRSIVYANQVVVDIATKARRETGKRKGFCALISIDIRNAFNTARWNICIEAMVRKNVPDYLLRMIDDYLSDRWVIYEGDKSSLTEEMTCDAPQGLRVGPLVWNVMYDDFLRMDLPAGTSTIGFADDALVVCAAEKTEALLVTDRRSFKSPRIVLGQNEIKCQKTIKYLGVQLDQRLSFGGHLQITTVKAIQCGAALTLLMPDIAGPREAKRRLVASVVNSKLLYAALIWTSALNNCVILRKLFSAQRGDNSHELSQHTELCRRPLCWSWRASHQ